VFDFFFFFFFYELNEYLERNIKSTGLLANGTV
jgi:hypothetical protein